MPRLQVTSDMCDAAVVTLSPAASCPNSYVGSVHLVCSRSAFLAVLETLQLSPIVTTSILVCGVAACRAPVPEVSTKTSLPFLPSIVSGQRPALPGHVLLAEHFSPAASDGTVPESAAGKSVALLQRGFCGGVAAAWGRQVGRWWGARCLLQSSPGRTVRPQLPGTIFSLSTTGVRPTAIGLAFSGWFVGAVTATIAAARLAVLCRPVHTIPPTTQARDGWAGTKSVLAVPASTPVCYRLLQETR